MYTFFCKIQETYIIKNNTINHIKVSTTKIDIYVSLLNEERKSMKKYDPFEHNNLRFWTILVFVSAKLFYFWDIFNSPTTIPSICVVFFFFLLKRTKQ